MSQLDMREKQVLEEFLGMGFGAVLNFSDQTFDDFAHEAVDVQVHDEKHAIRGSSKSKNRRAFWDNESDYLVGRLLDALINYTQETANETTDEAPKKAELCRLIVGRILAGGPSLDDLKQKARSLNSNHLAEQLRRIKDSVETNPSLAIGTAKELIKTCCKMILAERGQEFSGTPNIPTLTRATLKELNLVPDRYSKLRAMG